MAQTAKERRAAQRELARHIQNRGGKLRLTQRVLPSRITTRAREAHYDWANAVMRGDIPRPEPGTPEAKSLAALASHASRGKAPAEYEAAFKEYWYHGKDFSEYYPEKE